MQCSAGNKSDLSTQDAEKLSVFERHQISGEMQSDLCLRCLDDEYEGIHNKREGTNINLKMFFC